MRHVRRKVFPKDEDFGSGHWLYWHNPSVAVTRERPRELTMGSLILSYMFLFLIAGLIGLAIGWLTRGAIVNGRRKMIQADIEEYRRLVQEVRNRRAAAVAGQSPANMV
jgi:hypothetical protein